MLRIENLSVNYDHVSALRGINLEVNEKEIVTLIGANGAGKSTTLMAISNLVNKVSGSINFLGKDISKKRPEKIVRMGLSHIPEGRKIFSNLTVYENLVAGTFGKPGLSKTEINDLLDRNYQIFPRLKERMNQSGGSLSGGEQQMLAIARGLMMQPKLIMFDEPSLGLAPFIVEEIFELILKVRDDGATILIIEQNASMALSIANRGYVLETGNIILTGSGKELLSNPEVERAYLGL